MAERERKLGDSVTESDYLLEFPCSPCERGGKHVESVKHCADCNENLCATCLTNHNNFAVMQGHNVLDKLQKNHGQARQLPSQRCSKHGGNIIDVFCPEHDSVGCSTCISVDHSTCSDKKFIPDVAEDTKTNKELKHLETEMKALETKLDLLKKLKGDNIQRLKHDKDALLKEIKFIRKKMNYQLDKLEKELMDETEAKFKQNINAMLASIAEVDDMLAKVKQAMDQLKNSNNDVERFVSCKMTKQALSEEIHPMHERVENQPGERSFELCIDENINLIIEGIRSFASVKEKYTIQDIEFKDDYYIRVGDDRQACGVIAMCSLSDGDLVIADITNKNLTKLDTHSKNVSTLINLPDYPCGLCLVDDNRRLAVSLYSQKKIQFILLEAPVRLDNSFSVGDTCRGLAHCDGLVYVCCGGSHNPDLKEGRGHVEVYNCTGELLRCLYEEFDMPLFISVINNGYNPTMYTADNYKGVYARGIDGAVKLRYPTVRNTVLPFCMIGPDQICIGEFSTGRIYLQTCKEKRTLVENKVVSFKPHCVHYDERMSRLFVATRSCDVIKAFQLRL